MNFDQTIIEIRERATLGLYDLALHVIVRHWQPLLTLWVINIIPWIAIDFWLVGWMADSSLEVPTNFAYYWAMTWLVLSQAQVGTWLIVMYLGKAMFAGRPSVREVLRDALRINPYYWFSQGVLRTVFLALAACLLIDGESESTYGTVFMLLTVIVLVGLLVRALRPFVTEILVLEKTPIREKEGQIRFSARSRSLHTFASSDLLGKAITAGCMGALLTFSIHSCLVTGDAILNIRANSDFSLQPYYYVAALWTVAGFICIVRFLAYIDLRIRQEGWAVELRIRAEAQRLEQSVS